MTVNANWPLMATQVAFNSGFATLGPPVWTDLTSRMWSLGCDRGRQYELDQNQTGTAALVLADRDEALNPANTGAGYPYAGCILPYRPILVQAQWPPAPVGGAVNLLNTAAQEPGPYDPSFESYTAAASVPWISAVGATTPVVGTTTPRAGSKDLTWTVANGTTVQGISYQVPCIPGRQYITSLYMRQSSASTQSIRVTDQNLAIDGFGRTTANGWGTANLGGAWTASGGASSDYSTAAGLASHSNGSVNVSRKTVVASSIADSDQRVTITVPAVATGAEIDAGLLARWADASNFYFGEIRFNTDRSIGVRVQRIVAGVITSIATATLGFQYAAGTTMYLRFQTTGPTVRAKAWLYGAAEPSTWTVTGTDTNITAAGSVGCRSILATSNTNTSPVVITFASYSAVGSVVGSSATTTATYIHLSVTWTATQPRHTIQLATSGTAVAGTVLLDDVQHEPGGSASTATTSGPVIYGVHRGFVERWPSNWNYQGMYGYAQITSVDAFATLAARKLHAAYRATLLTLFPDYYWPLSEPAGAVTFADGSVNAGNPPLQWDTSTTNENPPTAGEATNIPGDPSGSGVGFIRSTAGDHIDLAVGVNVPNSPTIALPAHLGTSWAVSFAAWATLTATTSSPDEMALIVTGSNVASQMFLLILSNDPTLSAVGYVNLTFAAVASTTSAPSYFDGVPHLACGVVTQDATNTTLNLYIDGVLAATNTVGTGTLGGLLATQSTSVNVGDIVNGVMAHVAIWNRALSASEVATLYQAGQGFLGETSGTRLARYLAEGFYTGPAAIDTGQSVMGIDAATEGTILLDGAQAVTTSENGNLWVNSTGTLTFTSRTRRYLTTTAEWAFGEHENPYLGDIGFDFDPQLVFNDILVNNAGGASPTAVDAVSQTTYGPRSYQRSVNVEDDNEAADAATWILATHKDPHQRIATLTIDPASNPTLWPVALGVEIGDRVTVTRRTAAFTMAADYFVEKIAHTQDPKNWTVQLQMSPAALWPTPWILDSATYSVLGTTTVLGY